MSELQFPKTEELDMNIREDSKLYPIEDANQKTNVLSWNIDTYNIKLKDQQKTLLRDISGEVKSGNILAIMGPSGAGKSTFLDILAHRRDESNLKGQILYNGRKEENIKYISSYVMQ